MEVALYSDGERIETAGMELFSDSFTRRSTFWINTTRCEPGETFHIDAWAKYFHADPPFLGPLAYHGLEGDTRYEGCGSGAPRNESLDLDHAIDCERNPPIDPINGAGPKLR